MKIKYYLMQERVDQINKKNNKNWMNRQIGGSIDIFLFQNLGCTTVTGDDDWWLIQLRLGVKWQIWFLLDWNWWLILMIYEHRCTIGSRYSLNPVDGGGVLISIQSKRIIWSVVLSLRKRASTISTAMTSIWLTFLSQHQTVANA